MGIKPKAIARIGSRSVLIPFPTKGETPLAPPIPLAPHEPTGVTTSASSLILQVTVSWTDASTDESGFYVYRNTSNTTTGATLIATLGAGVQTYVDNDDNSGANAPAEGTTYYYWVSSFNAGGESVKSPAASNGTGGVTTIWLVPTAPSSLSATAVSSSQINLSWTDNSNNETGFEIFRSTDGLTFSSIATVGAGVTTYNNTGLSASTQYYYKVWAYNPGENSTYSNTANATTQAAAGVPTPTFEVNFTTDPYVGTRFSRASRATFVNSSGFIQAAELNTFQQSQEFENVYWTKTGSGSTANAAVAPDGTTTADLITESSGGTSGHGIGRNVGTLSANTSYTHSIFVKKPATNARNFATIAFSGGGGHRCTRTFDLTTGTQTASTFSGTNFASTSGGAQDMGNGWWRLWNRVTIGGTAVTAVDIAFATASVATPVLFAGLWPDHSGDGVSGLLIWGAQLVEGTSMLPYVRTTTASNGTPRITHDPVTLAPLGLLMEAQATNNLLRSEDWSAVWVLAGSTQTANSATSPSGVSNGTRLSEDTTVGAHETYQSIGASQNYCFSVFLKAQQRTAASTTIYRAANDWVTCTFDLSAGTAGTVAVGSASGWSNAAATIENYGNGWYRCSVRATHSSSSSSFAGISLNSSATPTRQANNGIEGYAGNTANGLLAWGAQVEFTNAPPTSYIPTTTATVTRSGDGCGITSADLGFWNNNAGSVVMEGRFTTSSSAGLGLFRAGPSGSNQNMMMSQRFNVNNTPLYRIAGTIYNSGPAAALSIPTVGVLYKNGLTYTSTAFVGYVDGAAGTSTAVSGTMTTNTVEFMAGASNNISGAIIPGAGNGILRRFRYWNTALSNADMQTATT